jgi:hypothetical protein
MTNANDAPPAGKNPENTDEDGEPTVQSLTDFFDQLDRANFRRVLANREAYGESYRQSKSSSR